MDDRMLAEINVTDEKKHGGQRSGAGRPRTKELNVFGQWIEESGRSREEIAAFIGVSDSMLEKLITGSATPSLKGAVKIEELTQGKVHCSFWVKSDS